MRNQVSVGVIKHRFVSLGDIGVQGAGAGFQKEVVRWHRQPRSRVKSANHDLEVLKKDAVMRGLVLKFGRAPIGRRSPYVSLLRAIVSQQLSTHAARAIFARLQARYDVGDPAVLWRARENTVRQTGLSANKALYVRAAAKFAMDDGFATLQGLDQNEVLERLIEIPGVGPWTAQMVMIFGLGFPDVWPVGDAGLQRAAQVQYRVRSRNGFVRLGDRFRPVRSHAAWYLWRILDAPEKHPTPK